MGKYIYIKSFLKEYQSYIYINMIGSTGQRFLQCLEAASNWEPGQPAIEKPVHNAFKLYDLDFADSDNMLVVIDEIQDSPGSFGVILL